MSGVELLAGAAVLAVAAVGLGRPLLKSPVRRELRARPLLAGALAVGAALGVTVALRLILEQPLFGGLLALALAGALVATWILARPHHGRRRGLPPGSLGFLASLDAIEDPRFYMRSSARWGPVFKMRQMHRPVACITDLETGLELFRAHPDRLRQSDWAFNRLVPGGYLEYMDGELHARVRGMFLPAFTPGIVAAVRPLIAEAARSELEAMARASDPGGVHPEPFLLPIAQVSLLRTLVGADPAHPRFETLRERFTLLNQPLELFLPIPRESRDAYAWLSGQIAELARGGRTRAPSVLSELVAANPSTSEDATAIGNLVLMVKEGSIMVRGLLRWVLKMLADHPEEVARIREAASDVAELDARATAFVFETIRLYESPYLYRTVARPVDVGGFRVPKGWLVRLCLTEAHARPDVFPDPDRFDPGRHRNGAPGARHFCPFGAGDRECPGQDIAIEIGKTVVREAALAFDLRTVEEGPAWRIDRHWGLWRPSLRWRVALQGRQPEV